MTVTVPVLAGGEWIYGFLAAIVIVMVAKWFIGIIT